ncbi:MAG TPA: hypothetical protein VNQ48_09130 [Microbacteriaceae bacterium]|nr:hypothetical protein [Microbacteriaceae bacterium]
MSNAVIQVTTDAAAIDRAVESAQRILEQLPDLQIRVIVHGEALDAVVGTEPLEHDPAVRVEACSLGLRARGHSLDELRPGFDTVAGASAAIIQAQLDGAAYLRL